MFFVIVFANRVDGITNTTVTTLSSFSHALAEYYNQCKLAAVAQGMTSVSVQMVDKNLHQIDDLFREIIPNEER